MKVKLINENIEEKHGCYYIKGTRISIDSVIYSHLRGSSTEEIQGEYQLLTVEQIKKIVGFYLTNRKHVNYYLSSKEKQWIDMGTPKLAKIVSIERIK